MSEMRLICQKGFASKHYLQLSSYIEIEKKDGYFIVSDLVFLEISPEFNRSKKVVMAIGTIDLRNIGYAIKECLKRKETPYVKYTDPRNGWGDGGKKVLSVAISNNTLYLNVETGGQKIGFGFDFYSAASFSDICKLMAEESEKAVYRHQELTTSGQTRKKEEK